MCLYVHSSYLRAATVAGLILGLLIFVASSGPISSSQPNSPTPKPRIVKGYGELPVSFEPNAGQAEHGVKFLSRGSGYQLDLTATEAVLQFRKPTTSPTSRLALAHSHTGGGGPNAIPSGASATLVGSKNYLSLRVRLLRANANPTVTGEKQMAGISNYFIGNDPSKWRTRIPTYAQVRYRGIYPGIDLVYYGNGRQLEFDFAVAPHADVERIQFVFDKAARLRLTAENDLMVTIANASAVLRKPLVYQMVSGCRQAVAGDFTLLGNHTVGFRLGTYDRTKALVIDPVLAYSTFLGGTGPGDAGNAIAVDAAGDAYVAGRTCSSDFPVTQGSLQTTNPATAASYACTAFITELNPTGTALIYSTYLGGSSGDDVANGIALDPADNVYVSGMAYSTDFPVTPGAIQAANHAAANGNSNAFIAKLNPTATALVYSTYLGGSGLPAGYMSDEASAIAVDTDGNAYVTGRAYSPDFPVTAGAFQTANHAATISGVNAFVTKLNPAGTALVYSTYLGGSGGNKFGLVGGDTGNAIAVDVAGDAYLTGQAGSSDFPVTPGTIQPTNKAVANKSTNAFVTEVNPSGTALVYSTYLGGSGGETGNALAVDSVGNVFVAGQTASSDFPATAGAFQTVNRFGFTTSLGPSASVGPNAFISKLNVHGSSLVYATYLGGSGGMVWYSPTLGQAGGEQVNGLAVDASGNAYVTGVTTSGNFPVTQGAYQAENNDFAGAIGQSACAAGCIGGYNAFVTELNPAGSGLVYSTYLGGNGINPLDFVGVTEFGGGDQANALALDTGGNVYVAGSAVSYDFPVAAGAFQTAVKSGGGNAFIVKLTMGATSTAIAPTVTVTPAASTIPSAKPVNVTVSVRGGAGNPTPTGTVTLASGTYASAATTLGGGSATINIPSGALLAEPADPDPGYAPPPDPLVANYVPDAASATAYNFASGQGWVYVLGAWITVTPAFSYITPAQSQAQAFPLAMVATGGTGNPTPTGTVTLTTGNYSSGAVALSGGNASVSIPPGTLATGFNSVSVSYSGDSNYTAVPVAGSAAIIVSPATVTVTPSSSSITTNQALSVTVTLSAGTGDPVPNGAVLLTSGSYGASANPVGGVAAFTIPAGALPAGTDILTATLQGGGNYLGGASGQATVTVAGPPPGFTISGTAVTVKTGASTGNASTITVTPSGGFTGGVALTAAVTSSPSGAQDLPTLSFGSTSPVTITGTAAGTATLTVGTTAPGGCVQSDQAPREVFWGGGGAALACLLLLVVPVLRRRWRWALAMAPLVIVLAGGLLACGGGRANCNVVTPGTTPGTYAVTVTGTSGTSTATGTVTVTVQ